MADGLAEEVERMRRENPSLDERLQDYRRQKRDYDESLGRKNEKEPGTWRRYEPQRRYGV
jgi:hypothetical protein